MPSFTMELWRVLELKPSDKSEDEWLGLDAYPLQEGVSREDLNKKIKDHFMYQEIGHETVEQFTFSMRRKMNEIMPVYNELYRTTMMEYEILSTVDITNTSTGVQEQVTEGTSSNETDSDIAAKSKNVVSNFPQVQLAGNKDYASNGADSNSQTKTTGKIEESSSAENTVSSESESRMKGYQGNPAQLIQAFRSAILNVDMMIIAELEPLFMMVWNNGDEYSRTKGRVFY